jgi:hypothetical protein
LAQRNCLVLNQFEIDELERKRAQEHQERKRKLNADATEEGIIKEVKLRLAQARVARAAAPTTSTSSAMADLSVDDSDSYFEGDGGEEVEV